MQNRLTDVRLRFYILILAFKRGKQVSSNMQCFVLHRVTLH